MIKHKKKAGLPVYSVDIFQEIPSTEIHFVIGLMKDVNRDFSCMSTSHRHDCYLIIFITKGWARYHITNCEFAIQLSKAQAGAGRLK